VIETTRIRVGHVSTAFQSSLTGLPLIAVEYKPSDKSLGYYQTSLRDEQVGIPPRAVTQRPTDLRSDGSLGAKVVSSPSGRPERIPRSRDFSASVLQCVPLEALMTKRHELPTCVGDAPLAVKSREISDPRIRSLNGPIHLPRLFETRARPLWDDVSCESNVGRGRAMIALLGTDSNLRVAGWRVREYV
jgi:hypothetical protein